MDITQARLIVRNPRTRGTQQRYAATRRLDEEVTRLQAVVEPLPLDG